MSSISRFSILVAAVLVIIWPQAASSQWQNAHADTLVYNSERNETCGRSLAIDRTSAVHVIYQTAVSGQGWNIFYTVRRPGDEWTDPMPVVGMDGWRFNAELAVWPNGRRVFVAFDSQDEIHVAVMIGGRWEDVVLTDNTTLDVDPTIALDASGYLHVAWIGQDQYGEYKIWYAENLSGGPQLQMLDASFLGPFGTGASPTIAVEPDGRAHIFYRGGGYGDYHIHHAYNDAPGSRDWTIEILYSGNINDFSASAQVDFDGDLHLAVSGNDGWGFPGRTYYMRKQAGSPDWDSYQLASGGYSVVAPNLTFDPRLGFIHIVGDETSGNIYTGDMYYMTNALGDWAAVKVPGFSRSYRASIAVDLGGAGQSVFYSESGGNYAVIYYGSDS